MLISAEPKESSKQDSGDAAQERKTIFLYALNCTWDKVYNCAETVPWLEEKSTDYTSLKLRHAQ